MAGKTLKKTKHFDERWVERVGGDPPTAHGIIKILEDSILIQKPGRFKTPKGRECTVMAVFWDTKRQLVFKVDMNKRKVVTVLSPKLLESRKEGVQE